MLIVAGANLQVLALIDSRVTVLQDITSKYVTDARNVYYSVSVYPWRVKLTLLFSETIE